jgi:transposase
MNKASTIGLDLAKQVFQVHGADATGAVVFRRRLRRTAVLQFFASQSLSGHFRPDYKVFEA